jgi:hypothetical protein
MVAAANHLRWYPDKRRNTVTGETCNRKILAQLRAEIVDSLVALGLTFPQSDRALKRKVIRGLEM